MLSEKLSDHSEAFQLTTSHRGRRKTLKSLHEPKYFNSLPHTEVDIECRVKEIKELDFNSLPHTEVDPDLAGLYVRDRPQFQLTTSHRGRR